LNINWRYLFFFQKIKNEKKKHRKEIEKK